MKNKHILFDAYGTLFDLSQAIAPAQALLGEKTASVLSRWRILQLEYAWLSALSGRYIDFEIATKNAFTDALAEEAIIDHTIADDLIEGFRKVHAYSDAIETLKHLREIGFTTAILSNGSPGILTAATQHAGLDQCLDDVLSVDVVRTYKPARNAYAVGTNKYGISAENSYFVSSNWWDVDGARAFGYKVIWIDRKTYQWPLSIPAPDRIVHSLGELPSLLKSSE